MCSYQTYNSTLFFIWQRQHKINRYSLNYCNVGGRVILSGRTDPKWTYRSWCPGKICCGLRVPPMKWCCSLPAAWVPGSVLGPCT